jgi:hypothetical protein
MADEGRDSEDKRLQFESTMKIDSQSCIEGTICIEVGRLAVAEASNVIVLTVDSPHASARAFLSMWHARELATTLLAVSSRLEQDTTEP